MMEEKINREYVPLDIEHSGIYYGVVLCAKVKQLEDKECGLFIVAGFFENKKIKELYYQFLPGQIYSK